MDRAVVIANPIASQFTGGAHRDVMAAISKSREVEAIWPSSATEAQEAAARAAADGVGIVVAMGGDGMVHHVSQGLVGTGSSLAIIPAGTTNVAARLLQVPSKPVKAARLIARANQPSSVGVARMTLTRGATETVHHAIFACGLGLDAEVVIRADSDPYRKYRFGSIHYASTAVGVGLKSFPKHRPHISVTSADREIDATAVLIQFRSIYTYFGKIPLRFDKTLPEPMKALVMGRLRRHRIPRIAFAAIGGRDLDDVPSMEVWQGIESLEVVADPPVAAQADGESLGMVDAGRVEWVPGALKVIGGQAAL
jgi:diacylglycerol kinase family enzyme